MNELGQIFNYYDRYCQAIVEPNAVAGSNNLYSSVVPSNEIWVIFNMHAFDDSNAITNIMFLLHDGSTYYRADILLSPARGVPLIYKGKLLMKAGDKMWALFNGCTLNDDLYFDLLGYKMRLK